MMVSRANHERFLSKSRLVDALPIATGILLALALIWLSATGFEPPFSTLFTLFAAAILWIVLAVTFILKRALSLRKTSLPAIAALICLALFASIPLTHWPLRAHVAIVHHRLDTLAQEVRTGHTPAMPQRIGLFRIAEARLIPQGAVCLWTDLDPSGNAGLVHSPSTPIPLNLFSEIALDRNWHFVAED